MSDDDRLLTDADVKAIADELKKGLLKDFQLEVGRGVIYWAKRLAVLILLLLAVYGMIGGDRALVQHFIPARGG